MPHPNHVPARIPDDEEERLAFLRSLNLLDTSPEEAFDRITRAACSILKVPISIVCLVDKSRNWFKSSCGVEGVCEADRSVGFCGHTILHEIPFIVDDASEDERFKFSDVVCGGPCFRFYAGIPLAIHSDLYAKLSTLGPFVLWIFSGEHSIVVRSYPCKCFLALSLLR